MWATAYNLVKLTGWTLEYIETLEVEEVNRMMGYYNGVDKGQKERSDMASKQGGK